MLDGPRELLARDELVLEIRLVDGGADNGCDFEICEIALTLQLMMLMTRKIESQESVEGGIADIDGGDERDFEIGLEWADDRPHPRDHPDLPESVLHEVTGAEGKRVQRFDLFEALFEKMKT